jgi:hypothetical protein
MNYEFGDRSDAKSRAAKIRALFTKGSTIQEHAEFCIQQGVWTTSELRGLASIQARNEVRDALGILTEEGVPFAGPTARRKNHVPVWKQMAFWSKVDFDYNYSAYKRRERANGRVAANIARVCEERFGEPPNFIEIEDEPSDQ